MSILQRLSSQMNDRTEASNRAVIAQCLAVPRLLDDIAAGLGSGDPALVGDCAEVMTEVGETQPGWIVPYGSALARLISHPHTRVRWEAAHALSHIAALAPEVIAAILPEIARRLESDPSVIFRDHAVDILSRYAAVNPQCALQAYPHLVLMLSAWEGKHAAHALPGLAAVARTHPILKEEIVESIQSLFASPRGVVRKAVQDAFRLLDGR